MRACDLRVPPNMTMEELIPFLRGIIYAEEFYGISTAEVKELQYEEIEHKEEE